MHHTTFANGGKQNEKECPPKNGTFLEGIVEVTRLYWECQAEEAQNEVGQASRDFAHLFRTPNHLGSLIVRGYLLSLTWLHKRHGKKEPKPIQPKIVDFAKSMQQLMDDENKKYDRTPKAATPDKGQQDRSQGGHKSPGGRPQMKVVQRFKHGRQINKNKGAPPNSRLNAQHGQGPPQKVFLKADSSHFWKTGASRKPISDNRRDGHNRGGRDDHRGSSSSRSQQDGRHHRDDSGRSDSNRTNGNNRNNGSSQQHRADNDRRDHHQYRRSRSPKRG